MGILLEASETSVSTMLSTASELFNWVLDVIMDNAFLSVAFCLAILIPAGVTAFRRIKSSVR